MPDPGESADMDLKCPKCQGAMRQYERSGVHVDQCSECRGIFLDRGELERLVDAETAWASASQTPPPPQSPPPPQPPQPQYAPPQQPQYPQPHYGQQPYGYKPYKKRKSFLEELFD